MKSTLVLLIVGSCLAPGAMAELTGKDRNAIKEMTQGALYLRNNVPCRFTSGGFGIGAEVVTEVSPTTVDWDKNLNAEGKTKGRKRGVNTVFWGFGPNDQIHYGKLYYRGGGVVELWAEGVKPKDVEIWIRFVGIDTLDDFRKAYNLILSPQPLQEEHPEWPAEIRSAVGAHRLIEGMTKAQAFAVVGNPIGADSSEEGGKKIETWFPRQDTGASGSWSKVMSASTGFPTSLRFVDGKLAVIGDSKSVKVTVDK